MYPKNIDIGYCYVNIFYPTLTTVKKYIRPQKPKYKTVLDCN